MRRVILIQQGGINMKVTYEEVYYSLSPLLRSNYCACGNHAPILVQQLWPVRWRVECPECGRETDMYKTAAAAKREWRSIGD